MGKHLKKLRAEKAKVKLKQKKLPKGQNITDTSFKVKKIQIVDQLPQRAIGEVVTSKNQSLKDLLNHLQHHNLSVQLDGLNGIKELFLANSELSNGLPLRQAVTRVLELAVEDKEQKVRRTAISLLATILIPLASDVRQPFIDLLNKQLQRGLSHIHVGIQRDALKLLDLVLTICGQNDSHSLKHLLLLLHRLLTMTGSGAPTRVSVVKRLLNVSRIVFAVSQTENLTKVKEVRLDEEVGPLTSTYKSYARLQLTSVNASVESLEESKFLLEKLTHALIGVWTECSPDAVIAESSVELLRLIVQIILLFCRHVDDKVNELETLQMKNWYIDKFRKSLRRTFFGNYPFQILGETTPKSRQSDYKNKTGSTPELIALNLELARIYFWFKICKGDLDKKIENIIDECLDSRPVVTELMPLLRVLLNIKTKQEGTVLKVIKSFLKKEDSQLLNLLSDIVLDPSKNYQTHHLVRQWVVSLASNMQKASPARIRILSCLAGRGGDDLLNEAVQLEMPKILFNKATQSFDDDFKSKLNILYWCCPADSLRNAAKEENCSQKARNYIENVLFAV